MPLMAAFSHKIADFERNRGIAIPLPLGFRALLFIKKNPSGFSEYR
jgi:hypothetical protein